MKRKSLYLRGIITTVLLCSFLLSYGQVSMRDCFLKMPSDFLPYMTENNRLDCVDFLDSRMEARVKDAFGTQITLDTLTADYLHITIGEGCYIEMRLFPLSADSVSQLLCVSKTFGDTVRESSLQAYDPVSWQPQSLEKHIALPKKANGEFIAVSLPKEGNEITVETFRLEGDDAYKYRKELTTVKFEP